jgi:hypothetical protein
MRTADDEQCKAHAHVRGRLQGSLRTCLHSLLTTYSCSVSSLLSKSSFSFISCGTMHHTQVSAAQQKEW